MINSIELNSNWQYFFCVDFSICVGVENFDIYRGNLVVCIIDKIAINFVWIAIFISPYYTFYSTSWFNSIVNLLYFMPRAFELHLLNGLVLFHASVAFNKLYSQNIVYVSLICWTAAATQTITAIIIHFMCQRDG